MKIIARCARCGGVLVSYDDRDKKQRYAGVPVIPPSCPSCQRVLERRVVEVRVRVKAGVGP